MKKTFWAGLAVTVMMFGMAGMSNAGIIDLDDADGVGYFRDTKTGYTWIDVDNAYVGDSFNAIVAALKGTIWQIATHDDLSEMLSQATPLSNNFEYWAGIMGSVVEGDSFWIQGIYENGDTTQNTYGSAWAGEQDANWIFVNPTGSNLGAQYIPEQWTRNTIANTGAWIFTKEQFRPIAPVPEPATMLLFGIGLVGLAGFRLRRQKK